MVIMMMANVIKMTAVLCTHHVEGGGRATEGGVLEGHGLPTTHVIDVREILTNGRSKQRGSGPCAFFTMIMVGRRSSAA